MDPLCQCRSGVAGHLSTSAATGSGPRGFGTPARSSTVAGLNEVDFSLYNCHSVTQDPKPEADPFAMAKADVENLNQMVCDQRGGSSAVPILTVPLLAVRVS